MSKANTDKVAVDVVEEVKRFGVVPSKYRDKYRKAGHAGTCGDNIANEIKATLTSGTTLEELAEANDLTMDKWLHLNNGMQRMNLGNVLRNRLKKGIKVNIPTCKVA